MASNTSHALEEGETPVSQAENCASPSQSSMHGKSGDVEVVIAEDTPLLHRTSRASSQKGPSELYAPDTRWTVPIVFAIILILQCGDQLMSAPLTRIYESIYCYQYWEAVDPAKLLLSRASIGPGALGGVEESLCKVPMIQGKVAILNGNLALFNSIPSLLLAIPFGMLADRWGRKPVVILGLISFPLAASWISIVCWFWQMFNIRLIYLSSLHGLCGGSSTVVSAVITTMLADVVPDEKRASMFFQMSSCSMLMNFCIPPVAAFLMEMNPWIPTFLGVILETAGIPMMLLVPETLHLARNRSADEPSTPQPDGHTIESHWITSLRGIGNLLTRDWRIPVLAATFFLHLYIQYANILMLQYVSTRFKIRFSQATYIVSLRSGFSIGILLVLLPWISHYMISHYGYRSKSKDLALARVSAVVAGLGWILTALAPTIPLYVVAVFIMSLGGGFPHLVRSFLTSLVSPSDVAKLYTILSVLDTIGMMGASPLFAWLYKVGLDIGVYGQGLPFVCLGLVHVVFAAVAYCIRIRKEDRGEQIDADMFEP